MLWLILVACGKHAVPAGAVPVSACPASLPGDDLGPVVRAASDLAGNDGQRVRLVGVVRETTGLSAGEGWFVLPDATELSFGGPLPHGWDGLLGKCVTTVATLHSSDGKPWIEEPDGPLPVP
jgi:hypothetical protein